MRVTDRIYDRLLKNKIFAFKKDTKDYIIEPLQKSFLRWIHCETGRELMDEAPEFYQTLSEMHGKYQILHPTILKLLLTELYGNFTNKEYAPLFRDKIIHQINTFFLGLYLYDQSELIKSSIQDWMEKSTPEVSFSKQSTEDYGIESFRYSGGTPHSEFLFRWRITALFHDVGSITSIKEQNRPEINEYLKSVMGISHSKPITLQEILNLKINKNQSFLKLLDDEIEEIQLQNYVDFQKSNPFKGVDCNHGIFGGLWFYFLMDKLYADKLYGGKEVFVEKVNENKIVWTRETLNGPLKDVTKAIILHDLDTYKENFLKHLNLPNIFDFKKKPLAALLKLADLLQEWHKPEMQDITGPLKPSNLDIYAEDEKLMVTGIGKDKTNKIEKIIHAYFEPTTFIKIKD